MKEDSNTFHMTPITLIFIHKIVIFQCQSPYKSNSPRIPGTRDSEIRALLYLDLKNNKLNFLRSDASRMPPSQSVLLVCASLAQSSSSFAILRPLLLARFVKSPSFFEEKKVGSLWRLWRARGWATTRNVTSVFFAAHPLPPFSS